MLEDDISEAEKEKLASRMRFFRTKSHIVKRIIVDNVYEWARCYYDPKKGVFRNFFYSCLIGKVREMGGSIYNPDFFDSRGEKIL